MFISYMNINQNRSPYTIDTSLQLQNLHRNNYRETKISVTMT